MTTRDLSALRRGDNLTVVRFEDDGDEVILVDRAGAEYAVPRINDATPVRVLQDKIDELYRTEAMHIRRGFKITDIDMQGVAVHLIEEAAELLDATLLSGNSDKIEEEEEAGDLLGTYLHLLRKARLTMDDVISNAGAKMGRYWTTDPGKVTATTAGIGRDQLGPPPAGDG